MQGFAIHVQDFFSVVSDICKVHGLIDTVPNSPAGNTVRIPTDAYMLKVSSTMSFTHVAEELACE